MHNEMWTESLGYIQFEKSAYIYVYELLVKGESQFAITYIAAKNSKCEVALVAEMFLPEKKEKIVRQT